MKAGDVRVGGSLGRVLAGLLVLAIACAPRAAHAQAEAKQYFAAGAAAYAAGDYQAAIQAFDAAYLASPLPAIGFSLAQAERRQYFASHEPAHLLRAIELFRDYLAQVPTGGRRADATDALAQLEPLALALQHEPSAEPGASGPTAEAKKTRLMVRCEAPAARISLDGAPPVASPLIVEAAAGTHRIAVEATGFYTDQRQVTAVVGEIVPIEVTLRERPATLVVRERDGADLYVDGMLVSPASANRDRVELHAGRHWIAFAKSGHRPDARMVVFKRGQTRSLRPVLVWTGQRVASVALLAIASGTTVASLALTGLALKRQDDARMLDQQRKSAPLTPQQLREYHDALETRGRLRIAATTGLIASAACALTGALLYQLDEASPAEMAPRPDSRAPQLSLAVLPMQRGPELHVNVTASF